MHKSRFAQSAFAVLECDGMKALPGTADIIADDDGTGLVVIHTDSRGRIPVHVLLHDGGWNQGVMARNALIGYS